MAATYIANMIYHTYEGVVQDIFLFIFILVRKTMVYYEIL